MEDTLRECKEPQGKRCEPVLILVLMEDTLRVKNVNVVPQENYVS